MNGFNLRAATIRDLPVLKSFEQGVITAERPYEPQLKEDPIQYYDLASLIERDDVEVAVMCLDEEIIASGYARIERAKPYIRYTFYSYVGFIYVKPEYRGKGIVSSLLNFLECWSSEQGAGAMHLDVFADNYSAIKAYEKFGFLPNLIDMRKML